ncbi:hypothetical protein BDB01DRAFT_831886 [Pilobolus umbonatus]|nr:hypothetical protein BDB01DRAFT_831886 [Pilobolus umbonatus]
MTYSILDQHVWDALSASTWYKMKYVYELGTYLSYVNYFDKEDRKKAYDYLQEFNDTGCIGSDIFDTDQRFPEVETYVETTNPKFMKVLKTLDKLLAYEGTDDKKIVKENARKLADIAENFGGVSLYGVWNRDIFEMKFHAIWYQNCQYYEHYAIDRHYFQYMKSFVTISAQKDVLIKHLLEKSKHSGSVNIVPNTNQADNNQEDKDDTKDSRGKDIFRTAQKGLPLKM